MKKNHQLLPIVSSKNGFTIVEVIVTLFVAVIFIVAGYQLYLLVVKNNSSAQNRSYAASLADNYLDKAVSNTKTCQTIGSTQIAVDHNNKVFLSVETPYGCNTNPIIKIDITVNYFDINKPKTLIVSRYSYIGNNS